MISDSLKSNMPKALQPSVASYKVVGEVVDIRLKKRSCFWSADYSNCLW